MPVKVTGDPLKPLIKQVQSLQKDWIEVGHFNEQGLHNSGYTYAELMSFHHNGGDPSGDSPVIPRPLLDILWGRYRNLNIPSVKAAFTRWKKRPLSDESTKKLLDEIGRAIAKVEKDMFGDASVLPVTNNPTPLVLTGDLKNHVAHRDSRNKKVRK